MNSVIAAHPGLQESFRTDHMRRAFQDKLIALRVAADPQFVKFIEYLTFFEILGMYVKNRYIPLRDITQAYDGPIQTIDIVWRDFIRLWEQEAHVPPGLFENAIFLMDATRIKAKHPKCYRVLFRFGKYL